jgi:uncharacterized protein YhbP (UPF0306 family)
MKKSIGEVLKEILEGEKIMVLATSFKDIPWATPVIYAWDGDKKFYFLSRKSTRHAQNILKNENMSASIYPKELRPLRGIQMEGKVKVLKGKENLKALKIYTKRFPGVRERLPYLKELLKKRKEFSFFEFEVKKIYLLSEEHFGWGKRVDVTDILATL